MHKFINTFLILGLLFVCFAAAQENSTEPTTAPTSAPTSAPTGTVTPSPTPVDNNSTEAPVTSSPTPSSTPSPLASTGFVTRTDYQDSTCTTQLRTATFAINKCSTGYLFPTFYNDGRDNAIAISFFNTSGCAAKGLVVKSDFKVGECIPGTPLSIKYTYSSTLPTITSGLYTFTQFDPNATACSGKLMAVTQLQGICYLKPFGTYQSEKIVCSGTTSYTTTSCTDTACSEGCVTRVTAVADAGCAKYDHNYNSCSAAPGSYPPVPTNAPTPGAGTGIAFGSSGEATSGSAESTATNNGGSGGSGNNGGNNNAQGSSPSATGAVQASCAGWGSTMSIVAMMAGAIVVLL